MSVDLFSQHPGLHDEIYPSKPSNLKVGMLVRWGSMWIGVHYSPKHKRACINLIPFVTIWIAAPGGEAPTKEY